MWSKQHDAFALEKKLSPAAALLWRWLAGQGESTDVEPDLNDFNQWVKRQRGKPYCRQTLKDAIAKLEKVGIVRIARRFTWRVSRLVVRSLKWVKENLRERKQICDSSAETPVKSNPGYSSSSFRSNPPKTPPDQVQFLCKVYGVPYLPELIHYSIDQVRDALKLFRLRNKRRSILNPVGWLLRCLNSGWRDDQNLVNPEPLLDVISDGRSKAVIHSDQWLGEEVEQCLAEGFLGRVEHG